MLSMTGYGRAMREIDGRQMTVELRSVNHRFLDLAIRLPRDLMFLEDPARKIITARLNRGHLDVHVVYNNLRTDSKTVTVDRALFAAYAAALDSVSDLGLKDDRSLMNVARMPDVLKVSAADEDRDAVTALLVETLNGALDQLIAMRAREGEAMKRDLFVQLEAIDRAVDAIEARFPETVEGYRDRIRTSVEELIGTAIDETRLVTEVAIMADRAAIDEEIARLRCHVDQLRKQFESTEPIGRRVDFIVQELNRETNTLSVKSQDIPITQLAVEMKSVIEKMREQVQNVE